MSSSGNRQGIYRSSLVRRVAGWLDAPPHPLVACEISPDHVAGARWTRGGMHLDGFAIEPLPGGAIVPTAVESNVVDSTAVRSAVGKVFARLDGRRPQEIALFVPDPVIRVFVLNFEVFPRPTEEAMPMLRWRLKKSVPFEAEETLLSFLRQEPRESGVDVVTALARQRIVREYEQLVESTGMTPGVVLSSTLAILPLLDDSRPLMLARVSGGSLTTVIVRDAVLCAYRCTDLPAAGPEVTPPMLLDEIFPVAAYYQDAWREGIGCVRLSGFGNRAEEFRRPLEAELRCPVTSLLSAAAAQGRISEDCRPLAERHLESLIGWKLHRSA